MRIDLSLARPRTIIGLLIAGAMGLVASGGGGHQDTPLGDHLLQSTRGADGKTFNNGNPVGCENIDITGDQVTSAGCNATNTFPFTAATCVSCGNPNTQSQPIGNQGMGNGVNITNPPCGKKRVGTCQNNEPWGAVMASAISSPAVAVVYLCNDAGAVGGGNCNAATQTTQQ